MNPEFSAQSLSISAFAKAAAELQGVEKLSIFSRLMEESDATALNTEVNFQAQGEMRPDSAGGFAAWVRLQAQIRLPMVCQRCMGPVEMEVQCDRAFRFVAIEALAEEEDENSEEDVLVISKHFDLLSLVEDELLMALPAAPKHPTCPQPVKLRVADADFTEVESDKPNPFAVLGQLKKGTTD